MLNYLVESTFDKLYQRRMSIKRTCLCFSRSAGKRIRASEGRVHRNNKKELHHFSCSVASERCCDGKVAVLTGEADSSCTGEQQREQILEK